MSREEKISKIEIAIRLFLLLAVVIACFYTGFQMGFSYLKINLLEVCNEGINFDIDGIIYECKLK